MQEFDVVIIGAGGAGMFCAAQAAQRGRKVALLDHSTKIGRKILISGGGRCNFTNLYADSTSYYSNNPHFSKSALKKYTPDDFIALVRKYRIAFHEKKLGQLFCDDSAEQIVDMLVRECEISSAKFFLDCKIHSVTKSGSAEGGSSILSGSGSGSGSGSASGSGESDSETGDGSFLVRTSRGDFYCQSLVVATGGLSIPQIGATGLGYDIARQFKMNIIKTTPALDGFVFNDTDTRNFSALSGVSIDSILSCNDAAFRENILFTHTGLSGPASLQGSLYWNDGDALTINLLPEVDTTEWLKDLKKQGNKMDLKNLLAQKLPKRFAESFCELAKTSDAKLSTMTDKDIESLSSALTSWQIHPRRTVGFKKAEVTKGGVDTKGLSSKTMQSNFVEGLFFIGEVVDVTGQLGGYNFQWAWSSAFAAAQAV
jgi:predicted flavoprotein YhiN